MKVFPPKTRVAVFRGGDTQTRLAAMHHGSLLLEQLAKGTQVQPVDVIVTSAGEWLVDGVVVQPGVFLSTIDSALIAAYGAGIEDGQLARTLKRFGVPYNGPDPIAYAYSWQKDVALRHVREAGGAVPRHMVVQRSNQQDFHAIAQRVSDLFGPTLVVKPVRGGHRQCIVRVRDVGALPAALAYVLAENPACIIEEYIDGIPLTLTIAPGLRNQADYTTPALQWQHAFQTKDQYDELEQNELLHALSLSSKTRTHVQDAAQQAYAALGLAGSVRIDMQLNAANTPYFIEANLVAPLGEESALRQTLDAVGVSIPEYTAHLVSSVTK